jgi:hypothetical protein
MSTTINKIFHRITKRSWFRRNPPKNLTILSNGGITLTRKGVESQYDSILEGGFLAAITMFAETSFATELNQVRLEGNSIIIKRSHNFIVYVIFDYPKKVDDAEAKEVLSDLLSYLEHQCPEIDACGGYIDPDKVKYLLKQYANSMC